MVYGNYGSLNPNNANSYGEIATGYEMSAGRIGSTTSPQTANQVSEVMLRLNEGTKTVELSTQPDIFEMTPQEQFNEINQIAKIAGSLQRPMRQLSILQVLAEGEKDRGHHGARPQGWKQKNIFWIPQEGCLMQIPREI